MRKVLSELDDYWKQVYDAVLPLLKKNSELLDTVQQQKEDLDALSKRAEEYQRQTVTADQERRRLLAENRYLRRMLKTHLYPAIAEQILREENLLDKTGSELPETAMGELCDGDFPSAFTETVAADRKSRTELLLERLWAESGGDAV